MFVTVLVTNKNRTKQSPNWLGTARVSKIASDCHFDDERPERSSKIPRSELRMQIERERDLEDAEISRFMREHQRGT